MNELRPASPCIKVCVLDAAARCTGCGRTIDEITRWAQMSAGEQWAVVERLSEARGPAWHRVEAPPHRCS